MALLDEIRAALSQIESETYKPIDELDIKARLRKIVNGATPTELEIQGELIAFTLFEGNNSKLSGWASYYSPEVMGMSDGSTITIPNIEMITQDILRYWLTRSQECSHPVMLSRYLGLIWDFGKVVGIRPPFTIALNHIDMLLTSIEQSMITKPRVLYTKLERALSLAMTFDKPDFIERTVKGILKCESSIPDNKPGRWGISYDLLINNHYVTDEVKIEIINGLEVRLDNLSKGNNDSQPDPWASEAAASRLAKYYKSFNKQKDVERVISKYGEAYESRIAIAKGIQALGWMEKLHEIYASYGLKKQSEAVLVRLSQWEDTRDNNNAEGVTHRFEFPSIDIRTHVEDFLTNNITDIYNGLAAQYVPNKANAAQEMIAQARRTPLLANVTKKSYAGSRLLSTIGAVEEDFDSNLIVHIVQSMDFQSIFLGFTLRRGIDKGLITVDSLMDFISKSTVIVQERLPLVRLGLVAYFSKEYITTAHLIIPQIEEACRRLVLVNGGNTWKHSTKYGGFNVSTFGTILEHEQFVAELGEDVSLYFTILFTDQRGWNLRNNIMHGLVRPAAFTEKMADRLIHALLILGLCYYVSE